MAQIELKTDDVIMAWTSELDKKIADRPEAVRSRLAFGDQALKLLAEGEPVSPQKLAAATELTLAEVEVILAEIKAQGGELDGDGHLVGMALTLNPTAHRFIMNGRTLYTWCALDAMFIPGLLGKTAAVESRCPQTNGVIRLTISPDDVLAVQPATTVLSIAVPGLSCRREDDDDTKPKTGPFSDGCSQMHFFASRAVAESWVEAHPGVAILSVEDAYRLAHANWISRRGDLSSQPSNDLHPQSADCCC